MCDTKVEKESIAVSVIKLLCNLHVFHTLSCIGIWTNDLNLSYLV